MDLNDKQRIQLFLEDIKKRMSDEMPHILKQVGIYEAKLAKGELAQFHTNPNKNN